MFSLQLCPGMNILLNLLLFDFLTEKINIHFLLHQDYLYSELLTLGHLCHPRRNLAWENFATLDDLEKQKKLLSVIFSRNIKNFVNLWLFKASGQFSHLFCETRSIDWPTRERAKNDKSVKRSSRSPFSFYSLPSTTLDFSYKSRLNIFFIFL